MTQARDDGAHIAAVRSIADPLGWQLRSFTRNDDLVVLAALDNDPSFQQMLWVFGSKHESLRCLLVGRPVVPAQREGAILELCARINDGLVFGCAEYGFDERTVTFRGATDLRYGPLAELVANTTTRVLDLGARYSEAIRATLAGTPPADAVDSAESVNR